MGETRPEGRDPEAAGASAEAGAGAERSPRPRLTKTVLMLAVGALVSGVVGAWVKDWWDRPQPAVELVSVRFAEHGDAGRAVELDTHLQERIAASELFPGLARRARGEEDPTVAEVLAELGAPALRDEDFTAFQDTIRGLRDRLETRALREPVAKRRRVLLEFWFRDRLRGRWLRRLAEHGLRAGAIDPPEWRTDVAPRARPVEVGEPGSTHLIRLDDEPLLGSPEKVARTRAQNAWRQLWRSSDVDELETFLRSLAAHVHREREAVGEIQAALGRVLERTSPGRIEVAVSVANRGLRPVALRPRARLQLAFPPKFEGGWEGVEIVLQASRDPDRVLVVPGQEARSFRLSSALTVREIVDEEPRLLGGRDWDRGRAVAEARLVRLYGADVLSASVVLSRADHPLDDEAASVRSSRPLPLRPSNEARLLRMLPLEADKTHSVQSGGDVALAGPAGGRG